MKRIISAILCVVMLLCILPMSVFAQDKATPLILVQGYSGPSLFYDLGGENEHQVWGINMDDLKDSYSPYPRARRRSCRSGVRRL